MKGVILKMKETNIYQAIKNSVEKGGNKQRVAIKLGCRVRHINRLIKKYKTEGKEAFSHKNKGKIPINKIPTETYNKIIQLYKENYFDFNCVTLMKNYYLKREFLFHITVCITY